MELYIRAVLVLAFLVAAVYLMCSGHEVAGAWSLSAAIAGLLLEL